MEREIKGIRKVVQDRFNAWIMLAGLVVILAACVLESTVVTIAVALGLAFFASVAGKSHSFNWANAKEHAAKDTSK